MGEYRCYAGTTPRRCCTHVHMSAKDKLRPLLLTPPFAEGSNPGPFATLSTTQPLSHMVLCWCIVVLVYCCVGILLCWCIVVLMHCHVGVLSCWCIAVLVYCCVGVLSCWCIVVLLYCCFGVLTCWCIVVLVYCRIYIPDLPKYLVIVLLLCFNVVVCTYVIYPPT